MGEISQQVQALPDDMMALVPFDMGDEANAARIVFMSGVVETLLGRYRKLTHGLTSVGWYRNRDGGNDWLRRNSNHRAIPSPSAGAGFLAAAYRSRGAPWRQMTFDYRKSDP
jgi:hypothetical protein